jgi:hypothetical protein
VDQPDPVEVLVQRELAPQDHRREEYPGAVCQVLAGLRSPRAL